MLQVGNLIFEVFSQVSKAFGICFCFSLVFDWVIIASVVIGDVIVLFFVFDSHLTYEDTKSSAERAVEWFELFLSNRNR